MVYQKVGWLLAIILLITGLFFALPLMLMAQEPVPQLKDMLHIQKTAPAQAPVGTVITYSIHLTNVGAVPLLSMVITDVLPTSTIYITGGQYISNMVRWTVDGLPPGAHHRVEFSARLTNTGQPRVVNQDYGVTVNGEYLPGQPIETELEGAFFGGVPDLTIHKGAPRLIKEHEPLTYTLTIANHTSEPITGLLIADLLPTDAEHLWGGQLTTTKAITLLVQPIGSPVWPTSTVVYWQIDHVPPRASVQVDFAVNINRPLSNEVYQVVSHSGLQAYGRRAVHTELAGNRFGSGRFEEHQPPPPRPPERKVETRAVALGDLNGDGHLDVFIANQGYSDSPMARQTSSEGVNEVWLNDGNGDFSDSGQTLGSADSVAVSLADLDNDDDLDAFVANQSGESSEIWLNDGAGNFSSSEITVDVSNSQAIALGDLNDDGYSDLLVASEPGSDNQLFLNDGAGDFSDSGQSLGSAGSVGIALDDLNGDGTLDAVFASSDSTGNQVWLNDGSGIFSDTGQLISQSDTKAVSLGDFDDDGSPDLFVANSGGSADQVWLNDGTGTFSNSGQQLGNSDSQAVALDDLDSDGDLDVVVVSSTADTIWLNDGRGNFTASSQGLSGSSSNAIALGDLDSDGDTDAFVGTAEGADPEIYLNISESFYTVETMGGVITETNLGLDTTIEIPTLAQTVDFTYTAYLSPPHALDSSLSLAGPAFSFEASVDNPFSISPATMTLTYEATEGITQPVLYYYDESTAQWLDAATTCTPTSGYSYDENLVQVAVCHLTEFALVVRNETPTPTPSPTITPGITLTPTPTSMPSSTELIYLPLILK